MLDPPPITDASRSTPPGISGPDPPAPAPTPVTAALALAHLVAVFLHAAQAERGLDELARLQAAGVEQVAVLFAPNFVPRPVAARSSGTTARTRWRGGSASADLLLPFYGRALLDGSTPPVVIDASEAQTLSLRLISRSRQITHGRIDVHIGHRPEAATHRPTGRSERARRRCSSSPPAHCLGTNAAMPTGVDAVISCRVMSPDEARLLLRNRINQAAAPATTRTLLNRLITPVVAQLAKGRVRPDERDEHQLHLTEVIWKVVAQFADPDGHPPACDIRTAALLAGRRETKRFLHRHRYNSVPTGTALAHIVARLNQPNNPIPHPGAMSARQWHDDFRQHHSDRGDIPGLEHWRRARSIASGSDPQAQLPLEKLQGDDRGQAAIDQVAGRPIAVTTAEGLLRRQDRALRLLREIRRGRPLTPRLEADLERADPIQARRWPGHHPFMQETAWVEAEQVAAGQLFSHGLEDALVGLRDASFRAHALSSAGEAGRTRALRLLQDAANDLR